MRNRRRQRAAADQRAPIDGPAYLIGGQPPQPRAGATPEADGDVTGAIGRAAARVDGQDPLFTAGSHAQRISGLENGERTVGRRELKIPLWEEPERIGPSQLFSRLRDECERELWREEGIGKNGPRQIDDADAVTQFGEHPTVADLDRRIAVLRLKQRESHPIPDENRPAVVALER